MTFTFNCVKAALPLEARLALETNSWQTMWLPRLRRFLQLEQGVVFVGVLISVLFSVLVPGGPTIGKSEKK